MEQHTDMHFEKNRLLTFQSWPDGALVPATRIAKAGFYYMGTNLDVQCFKCKGILFEWTYSDQVMLKHRQLNPECPFVVSPVTSGNIPVGSPVDEVLPHIQPVADIPSVTERQSVCEDQGGSLPANYQNYYDRLQSFLGQEFSVSTVQMAMTGLYSLKDSDKVQCVMCGCVLCDWQPGDNPAVRHKIAQPYCLKVLENDNVNEEVNITSSTEAFQNIGLLQLGTNSTKYSNLDARLKTFATWPAEQVQSPESLAQAGFYYTKVEDRVRCFHCDGGLKYWKPKDDPWIEHAKWFPNCQFLKQVQGSDFIMKHSLKRKATPDDTGLVKSDTNTKRSIDERLLEAMDKPSVQTALSIGLDYEEVRDVVYQQLIAGFEYVSPSELINQVLNSSPSVSSPEPSSRVSETIGSGPPNRISATISSESAINMAAINRTTSSNLTSNTANVKNKNQTIYEKGNGDNRTETEERFCVNGDTVESRKLEEENRQLRESRLCKVCLDQEVGVVFLPCGHLLACVQCAPSVNQCPMCRAEIREVVRTYLS